MNEMYLFTSVIWLSPRLLPEDRSFEVTNQNHFYFTFQRQNMYRAFFHGYCYYSAIMLESNVKIHSEDGHRPNLGHRTGRPTTLEPKELLFVNLSIC